MYRIILLLVVFVFLASVGLWAKDQYMLDLKSDSKIVEVVDDGGNVVEEVVAEYAYGYFKNGNEVVLYDDLNVSDIERLLDQGRVVVVVFDGSVLNSSMYNFSNKRFLALYNYDNDYFYTDKYGMPVQGGYVIDRSDFRKGYEKGGEFVVDISL